MPKGACKSCGKSGWIVNKHFGLCQACNTTRLSSNTNTKRKPVKSRKNPNENEDRATYRKLFDKSAHVCEECGATLPNEFEIDGRLVAIYRYSHILPKSIYPEFRHDLRNFNELCMTCHCKWEFGDRGIMNIYDKNEITKQILKDENIRRRGSTN
jgi:hypothetical protein